MVSAIEDTAFGRRAEAAPDPSWSGSTIHEPLKAGTLVAEPEDDEGERVSTSLQPGSLGWSLLERI